MDNQQGSVGVQTRRAVEPAVKVRYCLYARKSSESEERQALSIDSQIKEMVQLAEKEKLEVVEIKKESFSAKATAQRPVFNDMVEGIKFGKFNGILTWATDRLSRNAGDLGTLVDLMDEKRLIEIRTYGQKFTDSPNEKFLLMILGSQAKLENDNRGVNVRRGLRARVETGLWPGMAPLGYLNQKLLDKRCEVIVDKKRAPVVKEIFKKAGDGWSGRNIYHWLKDDLKFKTRGDKFLTLSGIYRMLTNPFYYGVFEYPRKSGNWYRGRHQPFVSEELFQKVQLELKRETIQREASEFAFTKLVTCGYCGSHIIVLDPLSQNGEQNFVINARKKFLNITLQDKTRISVISANLFRYSLQNLHAFMCTESYPARKRSRDESRLKNRVHDRKNRVVQNPVPHRRFVNMTLFGVADIKAHVWAVFVGFILQISMKLKDISFEIPFKLKNIQLAPFIAPKCIPGREEILWRYNFLKNVFVNPHKNIQ